MPTEVEIAWAAGLFEGEGCCSFSHGPDRRRPRVMLSMTDEDVVRRFAEVMGRGYVYRREGRTDRHKPQWQWTVQSGDDVRYCLGLIWEYLGERRQERATEVIERATKIGEPRYGGGHFSTGLCKRGHDLSDPRHCYISPSGRRRCRTCNTEYRRGWALSQNAT